MSAKPSYDDLEQQVRDLKNQIDTLNKQYRSVVDNSIDAILLTVPDGRVLFANQAACELFQMTMQEIIKGGRLSVVDTDDPRLPLALEERARTGRFRGELNYRKKDGTKFPGEVSSTIFKDAEGKAFTSMIIRDETARRRLDQEIRRVKALLEKVYSSLEEAIFIVDPSTRFIVSCNDAAEKIFGYKKKEMLGKNTEFIHVDKASYQEFGEKMLPILNSKGVFQTEFNMRKKDGTVFPTEHTVKKVDDESGLPVINVSVVRDISSQRMVTEKLQQKQEELQAKAERLTEMNIALKVFLEQRDQEKKSLEDQVSESINGLIIPYLNKIRASNLNKLQMEYIHILESNLKEIVKPFNHRLSGKLMHLSPSETRVANYVKQGYRIKEIAAKLNISMRTVEFHRDNIRKKLGLKNKKINLKTYLSSFN